MQTHLTFAFLLIRHSVSASLSTETHSHSLSLMLIRRALSSVFILIESKGIAEFAGCAKEQVTFTQHAFMPRSHSSFHKAFEAQTCACVPSTETLIVCLYRARLYRVCVLSCMCGLSDDCSHQRFVEAFVPKVFRIRSSSMLKAVRLHLITHVCAR